MARSHYILLVLFIGGISALNPLSVDPFLPVMPDIARALAVDPGTVSISLGFFYLVVLWANFYTVLLQIDLAAVQY